MAVGAQYGKTRMQKKWNSKHPCVLLCLYRIVKRRKQGIHNTNYKEKKNRGGERGGGRKPGGNFPAIFLWNSSESSKQEYLNQTTNKAVLSIDYTVV